jgi:hypothetical protein
MFTAKDWTCCSGLAGEGIEYKQAARLGRPNDQEGRIMPAWKGWNRRIAGQN